MTLRLAIRGPFRPLVSKPGEFQQTLEPLQRMHRRLHQVREEVLPYNTRLFAVMADGPLDHIRQFQEELEVYRQSLLTTPARSVA